MKKRLLILAERWLTLKIGVELKCCLSFFLMLFFYCVVRLLTGVHEASILHMAEMMLLAYLVGWVQALVHAEFDEIDGFGPKEWAVLLLSAGAYTLAAWGFGWMSQPLALALFLVYMNGCGLSTYLICRIKRTIDARLLNDDLKDFQNRMKKEDAP